MTDTALMDRTAKIRGAGALDVHVGARLKLARMARNVSQEKVGDMLGVTFQQVQKYEKGKNRIGAGTLWRIANFLGVEVVYFYDGLEASLRSVAPPQELSAAAMKIAHRFDAIQPPSRREQAHAIIRTTLSAFDGAE